MRKGITVVATRTEQKALLVFTHRLWDDAKTKTKKNFEPKKVLYGKYMVLICKWAKTEAATVLR
jgi:hypothetical protein